MGINKLFSSKNNNGRPNRLRKRQQPAPPQIYSDDAQQESQETIRPSRRNASDERLSIASTLIVEPPRQQAYANLAPRHTPTGLEHYSHQRLNPGLPVRTRSPPPPVPRLPGSAQPPLFPREPSNYIAPAFSSPAERTISSLPPSLWALIVSFAGPAAAANLALSTKTLRYRLGALPFEALDLPENRDEKAAVLVNFDEHYPDHLLCFLCARYHLRLRPGRECLQPPNKQITHPIFACPNSMDMIPPRARLTHGRTLPFALVQLAMRAERYGEGYGVPYTALSRRWKCKDSGWSHATRVYYYNDHLLLRCTSVRFADPNLTPSQERLLLYSRSDYAPYFSVCEHWHKGDLMRFAKCALSHIPLPPESILTQLKKAPGVSLSKLRSNQFPKQCDDCKPIRRCPYCLTEYLIEIKLVEDADDAVRRFKHALCVTRWSDLGECRTPKGLEWASAIGEEKMHSFGMVGSATLSTVFETAVSRSAPTPKVMPLRRGGHVY